VERTIELADAGVRDSLPLKGSGVFNSL